MFWIFDWFIEIGFEAVSQFKWSNNQAIEFLFPESIIYKMGHKHRVHHKIYGHWHALLLLLLLSKIALLRFNWCHPMAKPLFDTKQYSKAMMAIPLFGWCHNVYFIIIYWNFTTKIKRLTMLALIFVHFYCDGLFRTKLSVILRLLEQSAHVCFRKWSD